MSQKKEIRYHLEVGGAKGFLAPLSFAVAEAACGFVFAPVPKYLTAGGIIVNSLWIKGSKTLQENGSNYDEACMNAYGAINSVNYTFKNNQIEIPHFKVDKEGNKIPKTFKCKVKENKNRDVLEEALALIFPNVGNPQPLTAGRLFLEENWVSGDEEIKDDEELLIAACLACYNLVKMKGSSLKKV